MSTRPKIRCAWDGCHEFDPGSHNALYCVECRCKRKIEAAKKRLHAPAPESLEDLWELQENRKIGKLDTAQSKNVWLLDRSRIGFFDIETTNLDASIGMMICACVKDRNGDTKTFVADRSGRDQTLNDREIAVAMRDYIEGFDYIVTYYGTRFDVPFLNTRLLVHGERPINQIRHIDLYFTAKFKMKNHSNKLAVVCETLFGTSDKTRVVGPLWVEAIGGGKEARDYIVEHCQVDVNVLEQAFESLRGFINLSAVRWRRYGASY